MHYRLNYAILRFFGAGEEVCNFEHHFFCGLIRYFICTKHLKISKTALNQFHGKSFLKGRELLSHGTAEVQIRETPKASHAGTCSQLQLISVGQQPSIIYHQNADILQK